MNVAVLGCGVVGGGVVNILRDGVEGIKLKKILDVRERFNKDYIELYTDNVDEIISDESIDIVVETMGGHDFSYNCIKRALNAGKNVVTANKEVIAQHLKELTALAAEKNVYLMFEASAGGGIPCLKPISNMAKINETKSVVGILNGTTNYILTRMQESGIDYDSALREAQEKGFAEKDPTNDVEGLDMVRKIAIISMLCFKQEISIKDVYHFGITGVTPKLIAFADALGYSLKFTCFSENAEDMISVGVEPVLVKKGDLLSSVRYETNVVKVSTDPNDDVLFIGKGAGRMPTAAAIVADIVTIRDGGEKMCFEDKNNKKVGIKNEKIAAIVDDGKEIKVVTNVDSDSVRFGNYKFYARIIEGEL